MTKGTLHENMLQPQLDYGDDSAIPQN